jgi:hypothetical protein
LGKIADRHAELKEEYDNIVKHVPDFAQYALDGQHQPHSGERTPRSAPSDQEFLCESKV